MELKDEPIKDFDDILSYVGGWGRYQKVLILALLPTYVFLAYALYSPILFLFTPDHWCKPPENVQNWTLKHNVSETVLIPVDGGLRDSCSIYAIQNEDVS